MKHDFVTLRNVNMERDPLQRATLHISASAISLWQYSTPGYL